VAARFDNGVLRCTGQEGLEVTLAARPGALDAYTKSVLPAGTKLQMAADSAPLTLRVHDVSIPIASAATAKPAVDPKKPAPASVAAEPSVFDRVADEPHAASDVARARAPRRPTPRRKAGHGAQRPRRSPPRPDGAAVLARERRPSMRRRRARSPPTFALSIRSRTSRSKTASTRGARRSTCTTQVPTAIIDLFAGQGGLLVEALGGHVDATLQARDLDVEGRSWRRSPKNWPHAEVTSPIARSSSTSRTESSRTSVSRSGMARRRQAPADARRRASRRPAPAIFAVDALHFQLDGDLRKLDGNVRIDLGQITYGLGGLKSSLAGKLAKRISAHRRRREVEGSRDHVPIQKGVASCQKLPIQSAGTSTCSAARTTWSPTSRSCRRRCRSSSSAKKVNAELEGERVHDPDTTSITIKGSIRTSVGLDSGALETC
jgi:hypothetical protein